MLERFKNNPELHPNRLCANIRESYPEKMVREYLEILGLKNGVDFIQQYKFKNYYIDFLFPKINLALEIDGERWHDPTNDKEIKRENIIKEKYLLQRFKAKKVLKKEYEQDIKNIFDQINAVGG